MRIETATAADVEALAALALQFRDHLQQKQPALEDLRIWIADVMRDPGAEFLVARADDDAAIAYAQIRFRPSIWIPGPWAELEDFFVSTSARHGGVGRELLTVALERARARGCNGIGLTTNERNEVAVKLYRSMGFVAERARWRGGSQLWFERAL